MGMRMKKHSLTGQWFGRLQVLQFVDTEKSHTRWLCQCKCGQQRIVLGTALTSGNTKSCGCLQKEAASETPDMAGMRFGKLVVVAPAKSKHNRARWICKCDCGKECVAVGKTLRKGKKRSCGCIRTGLTVRNAAAQSLPSEAAFNSLFSQYRSNSGKRDILFSLSKEEFRVLTSQVCFYCSADPQQVMWNFNRTGNYLYNGIDRRDNTVGYTVKNCLPCCGNCNRMKHIQTSEDFIASCIRISQNHKKSAEMTDSEIAFAVSSNN